MSHRKFELNFFGKRKLHVLRNYLKPSRASIIAVNVYFFFSKTNRNPSRDGHEFFFKLQLIIFSQFGATILFFFSLALHKFSFKRFFFLRCRKFRLILHENAHLYVR